MHHVVRLLLMALVVVCVAGPVLAADLLWEDGETLARDWRYTAGSVDGTVQVSPDFVTQGNGALCFTVNPPIPADSWAQFKTFSTFPDDWSRFTMLSFDLCNGYTDSIWVSVHIFQGTEKSTLVAYAHQGPGWSTVELALPLGLAGVTCVEFVFNSNESPGHSIYIDNIRLIEEEKSTVDRAGIRLYELANGSFEAGLDGWDLTGEVAVTDTAYFGGAGLRLAPGSHVAQSLPVGTVSTVPHTGDEVEAGVWVLIPKSTAGCLRLVLEAVDEKGHRTLLAEADTQEAAKPAAWSYLKTKSLTAVPLGAERVEVSLRTDPGDEVYVDFIQVGTGYAVKGVPQRMVMGHLMPWFSGAERGWNHWRYGQHDPARIIDGKRDIASVFYPYIGLYDSLDPEVIDYQTDLALAMGLDVIDIDWYGFQHNSWEAAVVDRIIDAAERKGLKVALRYEPKVHVNGWVPHASRDEVLEAVTQDIIGLVQRWGDRLGYLRISGEPVVGIFGMLLLSPSEWHRIYSRAVAAVGSVHLMGDQVPADGVDPSNWYPVFHSAFKWSLYAPSIDNNLQGLRRFADSLNRLVNRWVEADPVRRMGISIIYPGFDDAGVDGWGAGSRVLGPKTIDFYETTMDSADASGLDWVLVVTLNDWNEGTIVEPSVLDQFGFERAEATRAWVEKFKGVDSAYPLSVREVVQDHYERLGDRYH